MNCYVTFFWQQKKVTKENCARYDTSCIVRRAVRPTSCRPNFDFLSLLTANEV